MTMHETAKAAAISIHALREEGDPAEHYILQVAYISIHALREEGDFIIRPDIIKRFISIHALREEGDSSTLARGAKPTYFYPRPPRGGRRQNRASTTLSSAFLSTPSARRATG